MNRKLAVTVDEAADLLSCSRDFFDNHIRADIRTVRCGRRILVPVSELERWLDTYATQVVI